MPTEAEAHEKWCPMISVLPPPEIADKLCCIASRCMMWEWDVGKTVIGKPPHIGDCGLKRSR